MVFNNNYIFVLVCVITVQCRVFDSRNEGKNCVIKETGHVGGVCISLEKCQSARNSIKQKVYPQNCGFNGTMPFVCCRKEVGKKSQEKCIEYSKYAYKTIKNKSLLVCPFPNPELIIGGDKARPKEFPHIAAIGYAMGKQRLYNCGGSLISDTFVLSAAHCRYDTRFKEAKFVRVGQLNLVTRTDDIRTQEVDIEQLITHNDYNANNYYNDILLIKLKEKIRLNHFVRPICLNTESRTPTTASIVSGWTMSNRLNLNYDLLKLTLNFYNHSACKKTYNIGYRYPKGVIEKSQFCAGSGRKTKDTCPGDSGNPLQIYNNLKVECTYLLVGVTSFGLACGLSTNPAIYTRVSNYIEWIEDTVWP